MALRRNTAGQMKPGGYYLPELPHPEYFTVKAFERVLGASNWEVINMLVRLGAEQWQTQDSKRRIGELLSTFRTQTPSEANLLPVIP